MQSVYKRAAEGKFQRHQGLTVPITDVDQVITQPTSMDVWQKMHIARASTKSDIMPKSVGEAKK